MAWDLRSRFNHEGEKGTNKKKAPDLFFFPFFSVTNMRRFLLIFYGIIFCEPEWPAKLCIFDGTTKRRLRTKFTVGQGRGMIVAVTGKHLLLGEEITGKVYGG